MTTPVVIASKNGLEGTRAAFALLANGGGDTLDAAIAAVRTVEDDPDDLTVGYGGLPNEEGVVELDAAVMHGPSHRAGAVAGLVGIRHAADVARAVLESTNHVLLVGEGARRFAVGHGFPEENLLTERARRLWMHWRRTRSTVDDWVAPDPSTVHPDVAAFFKLATTAPSGRDAGQTTNTDRWTTFDRPTGTVHAAAVDTDGNVSCATTTSGLAFKIPGRTGDSPIVGAGLYCDNDVGSCGSTGRGESTLEQAASATAVELMRQGESPASAGRIVLERIAAKTLPRFRDEQGRPRFNVKLYLLTPSGEHAGVALWGPATYAVTDGDGTRLADCEFLHRRGDA